MSLLRAIFPFICIFFSISPKVQAKSYTEVPALVYLSTENQLDTFGWNLPVQITELVYSLIMQDRLFLWDSPKKNIRISAESLMQIEQNTNSSFIQTKSIFFNELWTSSRRKTSFVVLGISFINQSNKGKISYGYIDFKDVLPFFLKENVKCNENGSAFVNFAEAIYSRRYEYTLVQFGNKTFKEDLLEAKIIKEKAFTNEKKQVSLTSISPTKHIFYSINNNLEDTLSIGFRMFAGLEKIFNNNRELFFEKGGSRFFDFKTYKSELVVTRIEIEEVWQKNSKGIYMNPLSVTLYINNKKLDPIPIATLRTLNFNIGLKPLEDILLEKQYTYTLYKINKSIIDVSLTDIYDKALREYSWSQISRYVRFSLNN